MKKFLLLLLTLIFIKPTSVFASQTASQFFVGTMCECNSVRTNGGNLNATIDTSTGSLSTALTPGFKIIKNSIFPRLLTMTGSVKTSSGNVNSIFNIGTTKYVILGNYSSPPTVSAVNNIKSGSPSSINNANAIAYTINDPETRPGLFVTYDSTNDLWNLTLVSIGATTTSITVPASIPLGQTFDYNDQAGDYQAVITLSFI